MLTIAVSSRALFHLEDEHQIFQEMGSKAFNEYMRDNERVPLKPGPAFNLVRKLLALNSARGDNPGRDRVDVVLLSRNSPDAGMRIMQSILHYDLDIIRAVFSQGADRFRYTAAFGAQLFLSLSADDVRAAHTQGVAAAQLIPHEADIDTDDVVRIAFDGDSVLFSDEAEAQVVNEGLAAWRQSEQEKAHLPLDAGPFKGVLTALAELQSQYPREKGPLRIGLFTARGVAVHERALRTLRSWGIRLDEALFANGLPKGPFLSAFGADMFFDDTLRHVESAKEHAVPAGHVMRFPRPETQVV
jgi:5'-nucleotidase